MTPQILKYILDITTLLIGVSIAIRVFQSPIPGKLGKAFRLILLGIFILAANHLADTAFIADLMKMDGHTTDYLQAPIIHRIINLIGFLVMASGFSLTNTPND